ncbi:hypothetical protein M405DRAFT_800142 [Rhizopogon salebrosus TDB-379]|nr:hypothetical protein M405DRAFT_800142 [Rhizopogon salebrosus TDB-379]
MLFTEIILLQPRLVSPEIYARPDNEVFAFGPGDDSALPGNVDDIDVDLAACQSITNQVASISQELKEGTAWKSQACFLPVVRTGGAPIIGEAGKIAKAKVIAELAMRGKVRSGNLSKLTPSKFL